MDPLVVRTRGKECEASSAVALKHLEVYVVGEFLAGVGHADVMVLVEDEPNTVDDGMVEQVEMALADLRADRYERGLFRGDSGAAQYVEIAERLEARLAKLTEARESGTGEVRWIKTGQTFAEAWGSASEDERRRLLASGIRRVTVSKGKRGRNGLDTGRVKIEWAE